MSFAGHETTAATIATTLCFLAYHQVEQTIVYDEIRSVLGQSGGQLSFDLYDSLVKTRAAFAEALRMFPSAYILIREASEDTILHVPMMNKDGKTIETSMPIPKGTTLVGDMVGMRKLRFYSLC
jgi:cytochrome P450